MKRSFEPWIPAAFCAFLSFIAMFASMSEVGAWWRTTFLAFLPICFFFVGAPIWRMQREILELRLRLGEVKAVQVAATTPIREKR
jgi:hypothetical protein